MNNRNSVLELEKAKRNRNGLVSKAFLIDTK